VEVVINLPGFRQVGGNIPPSGCDELKIVWGQLTGQRAVGGDLEIHRAVRIKYWQNGEGAAVEGPEVVDQTFRTFEIRTVTDA